MKTESESKSESKSESNQRGFSSQDTECTRDIIFTKLVVIKCNMLNTRSHLGKICLGKTGAILLINC